MNFVCKEIAISDEEFGCSVTFSEKADENSFDSKMTVDEIMNSIGRYVMLARTYGEDEYEEDYFYFEASEFEKSGEIKEISIYLTETTCILFFKNEKYEIQISPDNQVFGELKEVLFKIIDQRGKLTIQ